MSKPAVPITIDKKWTRITAKELTAWWRHIVFRASASFCWLWLKIFHRLKIDGSERIPFQMRSFIVAANHTSNYDPFIVGATLHCGRKPVAFIGQAGTLRQPVFSLVL